jgi:hypothetical protein
VHGQVGALREVLPGQAVEVLVRAALPRAGPLREEDRDSGRVGELAVSRHLHVRVRFMCTCIVANAAIAAVLTVAAVWSSGRLTMMLYWVLRSRSVILADAEPTPTTRRTSSCG